VIGPSIPEFSTSQAHNGAIDLDKFMDFAQTNGLKFDAISWHELAETQGVPENQGFPYRVAGHVATARNLLAAHPLLNGAKLFVNEYAASDNWLTPGWSAGWIGALEDADIDQANRTCWSGTDSCERGQLDGLFFDDGQTRQPNYWVHLRYAQFSRPGATSLTRVTTGGNDPLANAFATRDDTARSVHVLVGRHSALSGPGIPGKVVLTVQFPYVASTVTVTSERIPNLLPQPAQLSSLNAETTTATVINGAVTITIDPYADGDAYAITLH
jgi:hypothetical protein